MRILLSVPRPKTDLEVIVSTKVPKELHDRLVRLASRGPVDVPMAAVVRRAIEIGVAQLEKRGGK